MNWSWMLPPSFSTVSGDIDGIYMVILWITGITFFITEGLLFYFIFKYRHKEGRKATYDHGSTKMEIAWTMVPLVIVLWIGIISNGVWNTVKVNVPDADFEVIVTGKQYEWNVRYPGPDGEFAPSDDLTSDDFEITAELHVPVDQVVVITLRSDDVLHSFFLPEMRIKQDAVPGQDITVWFEAVQPGIYTIGCAELCGFGHHTMNGTLTVYTAADFEAWSSSQAQQQQP
jgi:cytochrome c oxidase subunit 2